jgi:hypothetical protein
VVLSKIFTLEKYLGWLLAVQTEEIDGDTLEPPVPPGLGDLNASLDRLADFLRLDRDLIAAAAGRAASASELPDSPKEKSTRGFQIFQTRKKTRSSHG